MKTISLWCLMLMLTVSPAPAQDSATQQQLDKLTGQIQDMQEALALQAKRIAALERENSELRDKVNTPTVTDSASRDDLKQLAAQVQEIDRKRQDDRDLILKQIEQLGKTIALPPSHSKSAATVVKPANDAAAADSSVPEKGYYYVIKDGDRLSEIVKTYRDQGVKVTTKQILNANPGLDANKLFAGKKIFIPDPAAK